MNSRTSSGDIVMRARPPPNVSAWRHADGAVQANDFAIEHFVFDEMLRQRGELLGPAETRRKWHLLAERLARRFWKRPQQRRIEDSGRDGHHANAVTSQVARDGQRHAHD